MTWGREVDPVFRATLAHDRAHIRAPSASVSVEKFRAYLDAPLKVLVGDPVGDVSDFSIGLTGGSVPVRIYRPTGVGSPAPVILFIHGGGFAIGSLDTHDALCRALCRESGVSVLSVEYRLAPEHPYPAAVDDCVAVLDWIAAHGVGRGIDPRRVSICGDSAGGYLAIRAGQAAFETASRARPVHIGLLYPVVDPDCDTPSMHALAEGHLLTRGAMQWFWQAFAGSSDPRSAGLSLLKRDLSALPPVSIMTAEFDPLRDEGALLAQRLIGAGVKVSYRCYEGMIHGFASLPHVTPVATAAIQHLSREINARLGVPVADARR